MYHQEVNIDQILQRYYFLNMEKVNPLYSNGFSIHIDTISMGLPILYLKGSQIEVSKL